jgi:curli biogenesis system outer membrane secretion channel CsgG
VSASKHLLSIEERAGFYRFLSYKRLGEMEAGFSNNEPAHLCVKQAIEIALTELIQKGIDQSLWHAKQVT